MKRALFTADGSRLRAGWRLAIQSFLLLGIGLCAGIPLVVFLLLLDPSLVSAPLQLKPEYMLLAATAETLAVTASVILARRFLDRQSIESLGLQISLRALYDVLAGIGIALPQMGLIYALMLAFGWLTFEGFAWDFDPISVVLTRSLIFLLIFVLVGWNEELLSRGYHLQTIAGGLNLFWGVVISSAVFGLLHIANPNATWVSTAGIFSAGVFLAYGYIRTKQLWLPIGLHIGWNFFEGVGFGFPVSGLEIYALTRITVHGPELWTGGAFGPEAGLIVLPALLLGVVLIHLYTARRTS